MHNVYKGPTGFVCRVNKVIVTIACAAFAGSAHAELIDVRLTPGEIVEKRLAVQPGKFAELCAALKSTQSVTWSFRASGATDFNIHFHVDNRVEYPERREGVNDASGRLTASVDQTYCWMWTNRSAAPIALEVRLNGLSR